MTKAQSQNRDAQNNDAGRERPGRAAPLTRSDIERRAYDLFVARGCEDGHDLEDWLQAERELQRQ